MTTTGVLSCREIVELVTDYLEGDLDADTATALETHLELCPGCARYVEQIRETVATLGDVSSETCPPKRRRACSRHSGNFGRRRPTGPATSETTNANAHSESGSARSTQRRPSRYSVSAIALDRQFAV